MLYNRFDTGYESSRFTCPGEAGTWKLMTEKHPPMELLERFVRGAAGAEENRDIVRHLLAGCPRCLAVTRGLWRLGEALVHSGR